MPLQDLTPQLRTRLNRMEQTVGVFVFVATLLLVGGFGYYLYAAAVQRGWFQITTVYYTYNETAAGLHEGDPVNLMGFPVGSITHITAEPPRGKESDHNVKITFEVRGTNFNYIWAESSRAKFEQGILGNATLNVTRGTNTNNYTVYAAFPLREIDVESIQTSKHLDEMRLAQEIYEGTNRVARAWMAVGLTNKTWEWLGVTREADIHSTSFSNLWVPDLRKFGLKKVWVFYRTPKPARRPTAVWSEKDLRYVEFDGNNIYGMTPDPTPTLSDRAQAMVAEVEAALPNFLALTNQIGKVLSNSASLTGHLDEITAQVPPVLTNLHTITENIKDPNGSLGRWVIPTNINAELAAALLNANGTITNVNTNLVVLCDQISRSLESLAGITGSLNTQVQNNSNILTHISDIIVHSDQFVQGLKHHWLLRSAFKEKKTKTPPAKSARPSEVLRSPRDSDQ